MKRTKPTWLLVVVSTGGSSTLRVHAWRRLRSLGALYLQNSVCLLPQRPETSRAVARLLDRVRREGGEGRALAILLAEPDKERQIISAFSAERTDEYREICSTTPGLLEEIAIERRSGRASYTEIEESEANLQRLRNWLERVQARDYFGAEGRAEAEKALERCADALAEFEIEALAAEQPAPDATPERGTGRHLAVRRRR